MGSGLISFRGDVWRGRTTLSTNDRGDRRLVKITNGYVSSDGHEIRSIPGNRTLLDFSEENNEAGGYSRYIIDAVRPVLEEPSPLQFYADEYRGGTSAQQTLYSRAKPIWMEWFEQVGDILTIGGITRFREDPIYDSSRNVLEIDLVSTTTEERFQFTMSGSPAARSLTDATGAGLNGLSTGDVAYAEGITCDDAAAQVELDARVNGHVHLIDGVSGPNIILRTAASAVIAGANVTAGSLHRVRPNRSDSYPTPSGVDPYTTSVLDRIDDWNALTTWRVINAIPLSIGNATSHTCYPAWVANRQRDFSDERHYYPEGILVGGTTRGVSRREQRELPYRMIPEPAGDRIIIAAPGYNCLFQVPLMVPVNPDQWPGSPSIENQGIRWFGNDIYDKPRALGVPKCRLIDSPFTPAPPSPDQSSSTGAFSHLSFAVDASPQWSFPPGTYQMCCTYQDDVTGEEGAPSDIVEFTIPSNDYAYVVNIHYFHPGYIMPECLALRLNVYISDSGGSALGFYKSFDLRDAQASSLQYLGFLMTGAAASPWMLSGKYGFFAGASPDNVQFNAEWRTMRMPMPTRRSLADSVDWAKPPVAYGMPRGASAARYIRGVLVSCGQIGTDGPTKGLHQQYGSLLLVNNDVWEQDNILYTRIHDTSDHLNYSDGSLVDGLGVAARNYPDAYEGASARSEDLLPYNKGKAFQVDRVLNRLIDKFVTAAHFAAITFERLRTVQPVLDSDFASSPADPELVEQQRGDRSYFIRTFKGQLQVSDPGLPWRAIKAGGGAGTIGIQNLDPHKDDDCHSIGQLAGNAIICSRKETFAFAWSRAPGGEIPTILSNEFGCVAPNSTVEFDGGLAWLSERGPVALGASLQWVGQDLEQDFHGETGRYLYDTNGFMRHTWACHDQQRGIVYWGLVTKDSETEIQDGFGGTGAYPDLDDGARSRLPCDEVLIWSYRANAYSVWRPAEGQEILWMREISIASEDDETLREKRIAFMTADYRVHVMDDAWSDGNADCFDTTAVAAAEDSTALVLTASSVWTIDGVGGSTARAVSKSTGGTNGFLVRANQVVEAFNGDGEIEWSTTVASADPTTDTITLAVAQSWEKGQSIRIGARQSMVIETTFTGSENMLNVDGKSVQVRYSLHGEGRANGKCEVLSRMLQDDPADDAKRFSTAYEDMGVSVTGERMARRIDFEGSITAPEIGIRLTFSGEPQVRVTDISLEIA